MEPTRSDEAFGELARGALRGPAHLAWRLVEESWELLSRRIAVFQRAIGVREEFWEDCGQEALLRVWRSREGYQGAEPGQLLAWIFRIVEREHLRLVERRGREERESNDLSDVGAHEEEPLATRSAIEADPTFESVQRQDSLRALADCLEELREERRRVLELLYSPDAPTEREVAEMIEVSKSQVHALRKAGIEDLARCLGGDGEEEGA